MENNFDRINKETQDIGNKAPKFSSNESKTFKNGKTKITVKHPIYKNNQNMNQYENKKASDNKNTYSSVRITTDTSERLHALLTASGYSNRDELIRDMINFAKPTLLDNNAKNKKYEKAYRLYKTQKKQDKELDKL